MTQDSMSANPGLTVYRGDQFKVVNGANLGDPLGPASDLMLDDIYRLSPIAAPARLRLTLRAAPPYAVAEDSECGRPGADLHFDCTLTFMSSDGTTTEALVLIETDSAGDIEAVRLHPLAPMALRTDYALVGIDTDSPLQTFAQSACVSFTRGTLITLASGAQYPVERLTAGDRVLTRDDGPQPIRWIGHRTLRAAGAFAPIVIRAGTLNNANDLVVSPDHRLFIYQRSDQLGAGRAELLVRARHLVNGTTVQRREGGFVDYFQMLFDHHQIIYAEGIAAESMLLDSRTRAVLPQDLDESLAALLPRHAGSGHAGLEVEESMLQRSDIADLLRRSSIG